MVPEQSEPTPHAKSQSHALPSRSQTQRKQSASARTSQEEQTGSHEANSRSSGSHRNSFHQSQERTQSQSTEQPPRSQEQARQLLRQLWQSTRVVGAVGASGIAFAKKTIELYQEWSKPIWRMDGQGTSNQPGSVARAVRDLKPQSRWESHLSAVRAMLRYNGSLDQKLAHGEHVYRQCRRPKLKVPKKSLIVIRNAESAHPGDVDFLLKKAKQANARVLLVDREWSRKELVKVAKTAPPGQATRVQPAKVGY